MDVDVRVEVIAAEGIDHPFILRQAVRGIDVVETLNTVLVTLMYVFHAKVRNCAPSISMSRIMIDHSYLFRLKSRWNHASRSHSAS
jgi:hypothetical protein